MLRTLLMQNKEDIIFTRMQQLDSSFIRHCFLIANDNQPKQLATADSAAEYFAQFILYFVDLSCQELERCYHGVTVENEQALSIVPVLETLLVLLSYIAKSGKAHSGHRFLSYGTWKCKTNPPIFLGTFKFFKPANLFPLLILSGKEVHWWPTGAQLQTAISQKLSQVYR